MSEAEDRVVLWCGQKVEEMTREELLEAFQQLARLHRLSNERHQHAMKAWASIAKARASQFELALPGTGSAFGSGEESVS